MMKILVIANYYPMFDQASGELRFYNLVKTLSGQHEISFCSTDWKWQVTQIGEADVYRYKDALRQLGISMTEHGPIQALKQERFDAVFFELYYVAQPYLNEARFWQSQARIIVDSVDIHFHRLFAKARVTKKEEDSAIAEKTKKEELAVYKMADLVIAVTDEDKRILLTQEPGIRVEVIPNIHYMPPLVDSAGKQANSLVFVGNFKHEPNVDAVLYFCEEIFPLIKKKARHARLRVIGNFPPSAIKSLESEDIEVLGYVPDTRPYLESSQISVAPLRYGSGMKGKIGEAMSYGVPVVTTSIGIEGFGLIPGTHVLVGDTPEVFAEQVLRLFQDKELYEKIRTKGWSFINDNYSEAAVTQRIYRTFDQLEKCPVRKIPIAYLVKKSTEYYLNRYVLWRFNR